MLWLTTARRSSSSSEGCHESPAQIAQTLADTELQIKKKNRKKRFRVYFNNAQM